MVPTIMVRTVRLAAILIGKNYQGEEEASIYVL